MDKIIRELKKLKPLWFIVQTTGGTGIDTEFVVKSLDELNELIFEKINKIDGIIKTETSLFLKYIKRQYNWGTAQNRFQTLRFWPMAALRIALKCSRT